MATPTSSSEHLQNQLTQLHSENRSLLKQEALLVTQLVILRGKLTASKEEILNMESLINQYLHDRRSQGQADFWEALNKNEYVFRGLSKSMDDDPKLTAALKSVAAGVSTDAQDKTVLLAFLTELSGQPASILPLLAKKVLHQNGNHHGRSLAQSPIGDDIDTAVEIEDDEPAEAVRNSSIVSFSNSDIKYEDESPTSMFMPATPPTTVAGTVERLLSPLTSTPARPILEPRARPQPHPKLSDLLHQLRETPAPLPLTQPDLTSLVAAAGAPSPESARPAKRLKPMKDVAIPAAFSLLMKKLEVAHAQNALSITNLLKCSKCQQIKRDARVLNCLHVYCHRCTQKLRVEAEKGDARNGFKAYCVQDNCTEVVSGKTAVIDAEVMELLVWYDKQSPGITTSQAQVHVLKAAHQKRPDETLIKTHLTDVRKKIKQREATGENDTVCNLLEVAKLAKKLA